MRHHVLLLSFGCVLTLLGCRDTVVLLSPGGDDVQLPVITVEPWEGGAAVDFGEVLLGEVGSGALRVTNLGPGALLVEEVETPPGVAVTSELPLRLWQDDSARVELSWTPAGDLTLNDLVLVRSNDTERPAEPATVVGDAPAPALVLDPPTFDFGLLAEGCIGSVDVRLVNVGRAALTVEAVTWDASIPGFEVDVPVSTPLVIAPGEDHGVPVRFLPQELTPGLATLTVLSDDPTNPQTTARVRAAGAPGEPRSDSWIQLAAPHPDVLFVIDNSGSMGDDIAALMANVEIFTSTMNGLGLDFRLAVTSTDVADAGHFFGTVPVVTGEFVDAAEQFIANVEALAITTGSGIEQGFHTGWLALTPPATAPGGPNDGFLRHDASLHIVFVSDEPEQSAPIQGWTREDYLDAFLDVKPGLPVTVSSVSGGPIGCASASPGIDYAWASNETDGLTLSICTDEWGSMMQDIAFASESLAAEFELAAIPVPQTVQVYTDGVPLYVGWTYDAVLNAVAFAPDRVPGAGTVVEVQYEVLPPCGD